MKNKARVHRLPTEDRTDVRVSKIINKLCLVGCDDKFKTFYHLYITTDEEIKEGDWCLFFDSVGNLFTDRPQQYLGEKAGHTLNDGLRKIIATTDPKLHTNEVVEEDMHMYKKSLPQIPQSFIEEYCKAGGIDEVLVEYEQHCSAISDYIQRRPIDRNVYLKPALKDNIIIIHPVEKNSVNAKALEVCRRIISFMDASPELKGTTMIEIYNKANRCLESNPVEEKMYSKADMKKAFYAGHQRATGDGKPIPNFDKWIEENL